MMGNLIWQQQQPPTTCPLQPRLGGVQRHLRQKPAGPALPRPCMWKAPNGPVDTEASNPTTISTKGSSAARAKNHFDFGSGCRVHHEERRLLASCPIAATLVRCGSLWPFTGLPTHSSTPVCRAVRGTTSYRTGVRSSTGDGTIGHQPGADAHAVDDMVTVGQLRQPQTPTTCCGSCGCPRRGPPNFISEGQVRRLPALGWEKAGVPMGG